ncbi:hypothetical protein [Lacinutrix himadriensis]|uniref:hypothetical protein n=1 Tax=Lacinutrix himadriensis TaxID=641549 RepID=UPI0006E3FB98|nr:hypothetical protein [Lacinutrix himadriensis]
MKRFTVTILKVKYILLALLVVFSFSCSPEDGEDGKDGVLGATGTNGTDGTDGTDGSDGNANVFVSEWIHASYSPTSIDSASRLQFIIPAPELTQDVINNSAILIYGKTNGIEVWGLPLTFPYLDQNFSFMINSIGDIDIFCDGGTSAPYLNYFKYVIIPSNTIKTNIDYSKMSYKEVSDNLALYY